MGASESKPATETIEEESVSDRIDYIATYYILTSDFKSLKELYNKDYCDDLVILTSDIIQKHLNYQEVSYLQSRILNGESLNEMTEEPMIFFSNASIKKDNERSINSEKNKSRMCIGIAKFYIKIAHIFAAIVTSINPMYSYSEDGIKKEVDSSGKNDIPDGAEVKVKNGSLCQRRLEILKDGFAHIESTKTSPAEIHVGPNLCNFKSVETLIQEPGIPELEELYYDKYDFEEGKFYAMTDRSREMYENDVKGFYQIFMGEQNVPETIRKFSDIKIKDFKTSKECNGPDALFKRTFKSSSNDALFKLFVEYSDILERMISNTSTNHKKLIKHINKLFVYVKDPLTGDKLVRIDPMLTMSKLEDIIINTRTDLITLYLQCEKDFNDGVEKYRAIAEAITIYKLRDEIQELEKSPDDYFAELTKKYATEDNIKSFPDTETPEIHTPIDDISVIAPNSSMKESDPFVLNAEDPFAKIHEASQSNPDQSNPDQSNQEPPSQEFLHESPREEPLKQDLREIPFQQKDLQIQLQPNIQLQPQFPNQGQYLHFQPQFQSQPVPQMYQAPPMPIYQAPIQYQMPIPQAPQAQAPIQPIFVNYGRGKEGVMDGDNLSKMMDKYVR